MKFAVVLLAFVSVSAGAQTRNLDCRTISDSKSAQSAVTEAMSNGSTSDAKSTAAYLAQRCFGQAELLGNLSGEYEFTKNNKSVGDQMADGVYPAVVAAQLLLDLSK